MSEPIQQKIKMSNTIDVCAVLKPNVPLSMRTIQSRTGGMKTRIVLAALESEVEKGTIRRVKAVEVGCGKYDAFPSQLLPEDKEDTKKKKKNAIKKVRKFNVFALVPN